jgi:gas vesicle protein
MKKYFFSLIIILSFLVSLPVSAEIISNSGFIPGQIWYSEDDLVEGETVNIHTAVWNGTKTALSAKVEFYDKNVILGSRDVVVAPLELKDVYVSWKITSGDHIISAKIISSAVTVSGKKETVVLDRNETSNDKKFVSVLIKNASDEPVSSSDALKSQVDKATSEISNIIPENVSESVADSFSAIDDFRNKNYIKAEEVKQETQKEIETFKNEENTEKSTLYPKVGIEEATQKPIAYIKLFLFSVLAFILGNKIVFYGIIAFVAFLVLRFIYRKIRRK